MTKKWEPKEYKDLRKLRNAAKRQIKALIEKENLQYDQIIKLIEYYKLNGSNCLLPHKQAFIADYNEVISFMKFEYKLNDYNNKNNSKVIIAYINKQKNKFDKLEIYTEGNSAQYINGSFISGIENRNSPFGGPCRINSYNSRLHDKIEYNYSYGNHIESYGISGITIIDDNNYYISYSKRYDNELLGCGSVKFTNGKIVYASFDTENDFEEICELGKTEDISRVSDKCMQHIREFRRII